MYDPEFDDIAEKSVSPPRVGPRKVLLWICLSPVLAFVAATLSVAILFFVQPLTHRERLNHPINVVEVADHAIFLADRSRVSLPYIKRIPKEAPEFQAALEEGVEIDGDGHVYGLLKFYPSCGMTAYRYSMLRVDLSELAGALDPSTLDEGKLPGGAIEHLERTNSTLLSSPRMVREYAMMSLHHVHEVFEAVQSRSECLNSASN